MGFLTKRLDGKYRKKLNRRQSRKIRLSCEKACKQGRLGRLIISCLSYEHSDYDTAHFGTRGNMRIYFQRRQRRTHTEYRLYLWQALMSASTRQYSFMLICPSINENMVFVVCVITQTYSDLTLLKGDVKFSSRYKSLNIDN